MLERPSARDGSEDAHLQVGADSLHGRTPSRDGTRRRRRARRSRISASRVWAVPGRRGRSNASDELRPRDHGRTGCWKATWKRSRESRSRPRAARASNCASGGARVTLGGGARESSAVRMAGPARAIASRIRYPVRSVIDDERRHVSAALALSAMATRNAKIVEERTMMRRGKTAASKTATVRPHPSRRPGSSRTVGVHGRRERSTARSSRGGGRVRSAGRLGGSDHRAGAARTRPRPGARGRSRRTTL